MIFFLFSRNDTNLCARQYHKFKKEIERTPVAQELESNQDFVARSPNSRSDKSNSVTLVFESFLKIAVCLNLG